MPIAHRGVDDLDAGIGHGQPEAEVGHDGDHDVVVGQQPACPAIEGEQGDQLIAVDELPELVDGEEAIGVAVEHDAQIGVLGQDHPLQ